MEAPAQSNPSIRETLAVVARDERWAAYEHEERELRRDRQESLRLNRCTTTGLVNTLYGEDSDLAERVRAHGDVVQTMICDPEVPIEVLDAVFDLCDLDCEDRYSWREDGDGWGPRDRIACRYTSRGSLLTDDEVEEHQMMVSDYLRELDRQKSHATRAPSDRELLRVAHRIVSRLRAPRLHGARTSRSSRRARVVARVAAKTAASSDDPAEPDSSRRLLISEVAP